ncbi:MAG: hypothetical protein NTV09_12680, partial [Bacteroidetes bacterium]|nr:hypothetical protein [Bacteroidota bacterium]
MIEPSESAYQGYDAMMLVGKSKNAEALPGNLIDQRGLFSTYRFKQVNGFNENRYIRLVQYEGYKLVEVR